MFASYRAANAVIKNIKTIRSSHHNLLGSEAAGTLRRFACTHAIGNGTPRAKFLRLPVTAGGARMQQIMQWLRDLNRIGEDAEKQWKSFLWVISRTSVRDLNHYLL